MKYLCRKLFAATAIAASLFAANAHASIVIAGTRVIFPANEREVTIKLTNDGQTPALVQTWIDKGDANTSPEKIDAPFTVTPSMFRLDPGNGQTLRLIYTKEPLAQDKETMFWLNVLEVPPKAENGEDASRLQLAFRTRIKVFFRPQNLPGKADDAPVQTKWQVVRDGKGYALKASNPTPYFVNLGSVTLRTGGKELDAGAGYIKPGDSALFPVQGLTAGAEPGAEVAYTSINDWGGGIKATQPVSSGKRAP
ncbi:pilus assembly protein [Burkholderia sp. MSMB1072]|uniref:fimbrial biogenesis chaperone n=1 Tax=Burkholderia sp. MSMB1072 TaxID=1637871 RepID=UPI000757A122|nr:fimbria/pilus periplasmic chaperone [Burkholderia sp. MSMB1072]KVH63799.1 pilus assembly protein [Burkholderia sp. MSMB1072]